MFDQVIDDGGIGERRGVTQRAEIVFGDLAQDTAHDLAGAGFRQAGSELDLVRCCHRADLIAHMLDEFGAQRFVAGLARHQRHIAIDALSLDMVRIADHGRLRNGAVGDERRFHLCGSKTVAGHVQHVIDAAGDPVIAILVAPAAIAGEVLSLIGGEVGLDEALVIAIDGTRLARPAVGDAKIAVSRTFQHLALGIDQFRLDAEEGAGG